MFEGEKNYYFSAMKLFCIILLMIYFISNSEKSLHAISVEWFLLAVTMVASLGFELVNNEYSYIGKDTESFQLSEWISNKNNRPMLFFLCTEITFTLLLIISFRESNNGLYLIPFVILDAVILFHLSFVLSLLAFLGVFMNPNNYFIYGIYCLFIIIIYFQNFIMIEKYRKYLSDFEMEEYQLKDSIQSNDVVHKEQLAKSSLAFENKMLEEKTRLSQALHDKLGHSINGSVYQLEACKLLMDKDTEQSAGIIQGVIDNLRTSMDEIRVILRREKPDKRRMAYLQLLQLCEECKEKYNIQANFKIEGEDKEIPELIWEVILDNGIEAITNALKYAKCTELSIEIIILHKVIRCSIHDNGIGCDLLKESMGLQGMKSRVRKVNGYMDITCDTGFHINMIIPL
jgi:signal transduction histidine kinase